MKKRIFFYYLILIIIGASITGLFTSEITQRFYKSGVEEKLKNIAILIEKDISDQTSEGIPVDYNRIAREYAALVNGPDIKPAEESDTRITFIDFEGNIAGESEADLREMENHLSRNEVQEAIRGEVGRATHYSKTLGMNFLYIAVPFKSSNIIIRVSAPLTQIQKVNLIIWSYTIAGILIGLLITSLLAARFSSSIVSPVRELILITKQFSLGNCKKRARMGRKDELGELAEAFNEMVEKMERTVADLKDKNIRVDSIINSMSSGIVAVDSSYKVILINDIACRLFNIDGGPGALDVNIIELIRNNQVNSYLKETVEKDVSLVKEVIYGSKEDKVYRIHTTPIKPKGSTAKNSGGIILIDDITSMKKLEQMRTEFVSNVTHELKTPLTSIRGFIETLRNGAIEDKKVAEKFMEIIDIEAERLTMLINDILQLSEIEKRKRDINIGIHNLKSIVDEVFTILKSPAEKKEITLKEEVDEGIKITANRDRIKQMLINLMDNGIKYCNSNGTVTVKANQFAGKIIISVKDTGIGIAKEHLPRIFERFYRVDKGRSRSQGGTGLGLSIVKHIVKLYGGNIKVYSEYGKGSEFVIQIPVLSTD